MKQTQLICDLCHDVITEYTVPGQLSCGSLGWENVWKTAE